MKWGETSSVGWTCPRSLLSSLSSLQHPQCKIYPPRFPITPPELVSFNCIVHGLQAWQRVDLRHVTRHNMVQSRGHFLCYPHPMEHQTCLLANITHDDCVIADCCCCPTSSLETCSIDCRVPEVGGQQGRIIIYCGACPVDISSFLSSLASLHFLSNIKLLPCC